MAKYCVESEFYQCPTCGELHDSESDAALCCNITPKIRYVFESVLNGMDKEWVEYKFYKCPKCGALYDFERDAALCCNITHQTRYVCEVCGKRHYDKQVALYCCLQYSEFPTHIRQQFMPGQQSLMFDIR